MSSNQCEIDIPTLDITKGFGKLFYDNRIKKKTQLLHLAVIPHKVKNLYEDY